jgi:hypothetical protein
MQVFGVRSTGLGPRSVVLGPRHGFDAYGDPLVGIAAREVEASVVLPAELEAMHALGSTVLGPEVQAPANLVADEIR